MQEVYAQFSEKIIRTKDVISFRFVPEQSVSFIPGQFLQVIFDEANRQNKDLNKYLSFSCDVGKLYFELTKKLSQSVFSERLRNLNKGDKILFKLPLGNCVLTPENVRVFFIVGGIGITPVISILEHMAQNKEKFDVKLLYSNWTENDIAFKSELDQWLSQGKNLEIIHTVVSQPPQDSKIKFGLIDQKFLMEYQSELLSRDIFIFGPPGMVNAIKKLCLEVGCQEQRIKAESFLGY